MKDKNQRKCRSLLKESWNLEKIRSHRNGENIGKYTNVECQNIDEMDFQEKNDPFRVDLILLYE